MIPNQAFQSRTGGPIACLAVVDHPPTPRMPVYGETRYQLITTFYHLAHHYGLALNQNDLKEFYGEALTKARIDAPRVAFPLEDSTSWVVFDWTVFQQEIVLMPPKEGTP